MSKKNQCIWAAWEKKSRLWVGEGVERN